MKEIFAKYKISFKGQVYDPKEHPPIFRFTYLPREEYIAFSILEAQNNTSQEYRIQDLSPSPGINGESVLKKEFMNDIVVLISTGRNDIYEDLLAMQAKINNTFQMLLANSLSVVMSNMMNPLNKINALVSKSYEKVSSIPSLPEDLIVTIGEFLIPNEDVAISKVLRLIRMRLVSDASYLTFKDLMLTDVMKQYYTENSLKLTDTLDHLLNDNFLNDEVRRLCNHWPFNNSSNGPWVIQCFSDKFVTAYLACLHSKLKLYLSMIEDCVEGKDMILNLMDECEPLFDKLRKFNWPKHVGPQHHKGTYSNSDMLQQVQQNLKKTFLLELIKLKQEGLDFQPEVIANEISKVFGEFTGQVPDEMYKEAVKERGIVKLHSNDSSVLQQVQEQSSSSNNINPEQKEMDLAISNILDKNALSQTTEELSDNKARPIKFSEYLEMLLQNAHEHITSAEEFLKNTKDPLEQSREVELLKYIHVLFSIAHEGGYHNIFPESTGDAMGDAMQIMTIMSSLLNEIPMEEAQAELARQMHEQETSSSSNDQAHLGFTENSYENSEDHP